MEDPELVYVPKYLFDPQTYELGSRNGVFATGLEHKMGLKASPTCELTFGTHGLPAVGYLVGDVHNGIAQMLTVIEHARMTVGVKAAGTLSTGYLNALAFAKQRVQGADLTAMTDKAAPRVTILHHPDVRRSLVTQKAYAEGLRALYLYAAAHQDDDVAQQVSGADAEMAHRVNDLLLPVVKGVSSERAYEILTESLQTQRDRLFGNGSECRPPRGMWIRKKVHTVLGVPDHRTVCHLLGVRYSPDRSGQFVIQTVGAVRRGSYTAAADDLRCYRPGHRAGCTYGDLTTVELPIVGFCNRT